MSLPPATNRTSFFSGVFIGVLGVIYLWLGRYPSLATSVWVDIAVFAPAMAVLFLFVGGPQNLAQLNEGTPGERLSAHAIVLPRLVRCFFGAMLGYALSMLIQRTIA